MKENTVTKEQITELLDNAEIEIDTKFGKTTIVTCKLANGFVIVESSSCVDPANYNQAIGAEICLDRIQDKLWELEGYKLQDALYRKKYHLNG